MLVLPAQDTDSEEREERGEEVMTTQELREMDESGRRPAAGSMKHPGQVDRRAEGCEVDWGGGRDHWCFLADVDAHSVASRLNEGLKILTRES